MKHLFILIILVMVTEISFAGKPIKPKKQKQVKCKTCVQLKVGKQKISPILY
jgi:hypothetical protein